MPAGFVLDVEYGDCPSESTKGWENSNNVDDGSNTEEIQSGCTSLRRMGTYPKGGNKF